MKRVTFLLIVVVLTTHATTFAQSVAGRVYVTYGTTRFTSHQSFDAITGTSSRDGLGVGGVVTGLWRGAFADVAYTQQKLDGHRAFVDQGTVYSLGIPTRITIRPLDIAGGWRFAGRRVTPYAGGGVTMASYREDADFSIAGDNVDERKTGALLLGGADVRVARLLTVGGELRYRSITGVLGSGGVSQAFSEDQLGGLSFAARVSVGR
jgi:opacity protein-like surface antigen